MIYLNPISKTCTLLNDVYTVCDIEVKYNDIHDVISKTNNKEVKLLIIPKKLKNSIKSCDCNMCSEFFIKQKIICSLMDVNCFMYEDERIYDGR